MSLPKKTADIYSKAKSKSPLRNLWELKAKKNSIGSWFLNACNLQTWNGELRSRYYRSAQTNRNPSRRLERQRGVVQVDAQLARWIAEVAEGVLHLGLLAIGIRKEIIPLRERRGTLQEHAIVLEADASPRFECKALVLGEGRVA